MSRLPPDGEWLIQSICGEVQLFHRDTGQVLVAFNATSDWATCLAQRVIHELDELGWEQKVFAHFWAGYFYARAGGMAGGCLP